MNQLNEAHPCVWRFPNRLTWIIVWTLTACTFLAENGKAGQSSNSRLDETFHSGIDQPGSIKAVLTQSDGKIVVAGNFKSLSRVPRSNIARLNADGSLDADFDPHTGVSGSVQTLAIQSDGKIVIGGFLDSVNGEPRTGIARINADGSLDASFHPRLETNANVAALAIQSDGKILLGGRFASVNEVKRAHIARLDADGNVDASFNPGLGMDADVSTLAIQSDGKVIVGGNFNRADGIERSGIARLNADGSMDLKYNPDLGGFAFVGVLAMQKDGQVIVGGGFRGLDGIPSGNLVRLGVSGLVDPDYKPTLEIGEGGFISALIVQGDGKTLCAGGFVEDSGLVRYGVLRLDDKGNLDADFGQTSTTDAAVYALALSSDGRLVLGGKFTQVEGVPHSGIARLSSRPGVLNTASKMVPGTNPQPAP